TGTIKSEGSVVLLAHYGMAGTVDAEGKTTLKVDAPKVTASSAGSGKGMALEIAYVDTKDPTRMSEVHASTVAGVIRLTHSAAKGGINLVGVPAFEGQIDVKSNGLLQVSDSVFGSGLTLHAAGNITLYNNLQSLGGKNVTVTSTGGSVTQAANTSIMGKNITINAGTSDDPSYLAGFIIADNGNGAVAINGTQKIVLGGPVSGTGAFIKGGAVDITITGTDASHKSELEIKDGAVITAEGNVTITVQNGQRDASKASSISGSGMISASDTILLIASGGAIGDADGALRVSGQTVGATSKGDIRLKSEYSGNSYMTLTSTMGSVNVTSIEGVSGLSLNRVNAEKGSIVVDTAGTLSVYGPVRGKSEVSLSASGGTLVGAGGRITSSESTASLTATTGYVMLSDGGIVSGTSASVSALGTPVNDNDKFSGSIIGSGTVEATGKDGVVELESKNRISGDANEVLKVDGATLQINGSNDVRIHNISQADVTLDALTVSKGGLFLTAADGSGSVTLKGVDAQGDVSVMSKKYLTVAGAADGGKGIVTTGDVRLEALNNLIADSAISGAVVNLLSGASIQANADITAKTLASILATNAATMSGTITGTGKIIASGQNGAVKLSAMSGIGERGKALHVGADNVTADTLSKNIYLHNIQQRVTVLEDVEAAKGGIFVTSADGTGDIIIRDTQNLIATNGDFSIVSDASIIVETTISSGKNLSLTAQNGAITATGELQAFEDIRLDAAGDIGTAAKRLKMSLGGRLSVHAQNAHLKTLSDATLDDVVTSGMFALSSDGTIASANLGAILGDIRNGAYTGNYQGVLQAGRVNLDAQAGEQVIIYTPLDKVATSGGIKYATLRTSKGLSENVINLFNDPAPKPNPVPNPFPVPGPGGDILDIPETLQTLTVSAEALRASTGGLTRIGDNETPLAGGPVTPLQKFPVQITGDGLDPAAVLTLHPADAAIAAIGDEALRDVLTRLLQSEMLLDACDLSLGGTAANPLFTGTLTLSVYMGEAYEGQTIPVLSYIDGQLTLVLCTVEEGVIRHSPVKPGLFLFLREGFLDSTLLEQLDITPEDLAILSDLYRLLYSTEDELALLDANTGTRLHMAMPDLTAGIPTLSVQRLDGEDESLSELPLADGETLLQAADLSLLQDGQPMAPTAPATLSFSVLKTSPDKLTLLVQVEGAWTRVDFTTDEDGRITIPMEAAGLFALVVAP
ncbi:hypothetical protein LJC74_08845, partial [Eubacteriales bacterium OttesenSCG-928-A19]|nr:hypothetical protein [Eubacteriales bacterium OttesenSCG-928-A19]